MNEIIKFNVVLGMLELVIANNFSILDSVTFNLKMCTMFYDVKFHFLPFVLFVLSLHQNTIDVNNY